MCKEAFLSTSSPASADHSSLADLRPPIGGSVYSGSNPLLLELSINSRGFHGGLRGLAMFGRLGVCDLVADPKAKLMSIKSRVT